MGLILLWLLPSSCLQDYVLGWLLVTGYWLLVTGYWLHKIEKGNKKKMSKKKII